MKRYLFPFWLAFAAGAASHPVLAMSISLAASASSPAPLGTVITWTAAVTAANPGPLWYRFRSRRLGEDFHVIVDYGPNTSLAWTASDHEGSFEIEASVQNINTGEIETVSSPFEMQSLVTGDQPLITPTSHPMVFLYSSPACAQGSRMRVQFQGPDRRMQATPWHACADGLSMNFYLAGMRASADYMVSHVVDDGSSQQPGPTVTLSTPPARNDLAWQQVLQAPAARLPDGILLQATLFTNTLATDLEGNLIWYYPGTDLSFITRAAPGGYFLGVIEDNLHNQSYQIVREFDLVGMTVRETNAATVSEQLIAIGLPPISAFHHEARVLPNGNILVLAGVEQVLTGVQSTGPIDILGDMIIVLNSNLQIAWAWNAFDHLDVTRKATLGDTCAPGSCPPIFLAGDANDWLHGNSVQLMPDGSLLYSSRSQDWIFKIDFQNGVGRGDVIWRLGKDGDFQIVSSDPSPWFSHQHDPQILADNSTITLVDNGNLRYAADPNAHTRGQVIQIDEQNRVATLLVNADLGQYSYALGAAQKLPDGNYHFDVGFLPDGTAISIEVDAAGNTAYALQAGAPEYRSFRMRDLYTP